VAKLSLKKGIFFFFYNTIVVCVFILIGEFIVRLFVPSIQPQGSDRKLFEENRYYNSIGLAPLSKGYSNGKLVGVDQYGFRVTSQKIDTSKNSWLLIGDSVTMCIGVESDSTFAGLIQKKEKNINILNPSVLGWGVYDYYNAVKYFIIKEKNKLKIDRAIIFYCLNDLYSNQPNEEELSEIKNQFENILRFLRINSRLYIFLKNFISDRSKSYFEFEENFYLKNNKDFEKGIKVIKVINNYCNVENIDFVMIIVPYEYQLRKNNLQFKFPQEKIKDALKDYNIKFYDSFDFFKSSKILSKKLFLYADGIHLSNSGHKLLAEYVQRILNL